MTGAVGAVAIALELVNVSSQGVQGDGHSIWADVSRDGRLVAFGSFARNSPRVRSVPNDVRDERQSEAFIAPLR